jgi:cyclopropane fatty-acyl-phospholipid synthase-like methyltransferase
MEDVTRANRQVWERMFAWINSRGGGRKYPNETVVTWLLGHARTDLEPKRVLDLGCGWSQSLPVFMDQGFDYWGVDVTDGAFVNPRDIASAGWGERVTLEVFEPPKLKMPNEFFSHVVSTEALHLNSEPGSMRAMIDELHRVLRPGGRLLATVMKPDYWIITSGGADWVGRDTILVNPRHVEKARVGATYFVFRDQEHIRKYFSGFSRVWIGQESRQFGEFAEKLVSHWIISALR